MKSCSVLVYIISIRKGFMVLLILYTFVHPTGLYCALYRFALDVDALYSVALQKTLH